MMEIIFENDDCLVVNKKAGESVEPVPENSGMADLPRLLAESSAGKGKPGTAFTAAHRLDVPVSGCVLFAKNRRALAFLNAAFAETGGTRDSRRIKKIYWAITEMPEKEIPETGSLLHWIRIGNGKSAAFDEEGPGRKRALLRYRIIGRGDRYLFFEIDLVTGRRHQIRAQFEKIGLHIKGDLKYGAKRSEKEGGIRLHGYSLAFPDPSTGKDIDVHAPPPLRDRLWEAFEEAVKSSPGSF
jgi:23S rRNA pseudouridine1911/1915/1917 synthase